jgi:HlyD family secretion protein
MAALRETLRRRWFLILLVVAGLAAGVYFLGQRLQPEPVDAVVIRREDVVATLTVTGEVTARETMAVTAPANSRIERILVDEGERVVAGQPLVMLDQAQLAAQVREAQANLAQSQANLQQVLEGTRPEEIQRLQAQVRETQSQIAAEQAALTSAQATASEAQRQADRLRRLYTQGAISQEEFERAETRANTSRADVGRLQAAVQSARSRLAQTRQQLSQAQNGATQAEIAAARAAVEAAREGVAAIQQQYAEQVIRASMTGVVTERLQSPGDIVLPNNPILRIADRQTLEIVADVQESDLPRVAVGDRGIVVLDAEPDMPLEGRVTRVGSEVDPDNGTVDAIIQVPNPNQALGGVRLLPGMTADVNLITDRLSQVIVVPAMSVVQENGESYVYKFQGDRIVLHPVRLKRISVEYYQVLGGLKPGDQIVLEASAKDARKKYLEGRPKEARPREPERKKADNSLGPAVPTGSR